MPTIPNDISTKFTEYVKAEGDDDPITAPTTPAGALTEQPEALPPKAFGSSNTYLEIKFSVHDANGNTLLEIPLYADSGTIAVLVESLTNKTSDINIQNLIKRLQNKETGIKINLSIQLKEMTEQHVKQQEAIDKQKKNWLLNLLGKIFGLILLIVATIATIATGGAAAPILTAAAVGISAFLIGNTVADIALTVVNKDRADKGLPPIPNLTEKIAEGITNSLIKNGMDEEKAKKVGAGIAAGIMIAITIISAIVGFQAVKAATDVSLLLTRVLKGIQTLTAVIQGATQIAQGVTNIDIAKLQKELADIAALLQELLANKENMQKMMDDIQELIQDAISVMLTWSQKTSVAVESSGDLMTSIIRNIGPH